MDDGRPAGTANDFIRAHTAIGHAPLVPEIALHLASEITPIWQASEAWLHAERLAPPFWAFAWPGSQAIARHALDRPHLVAGRRVLDFAAGCGLAGIACVKAGAASVEAADIDPMAVAASHLNAALNGVRLHGTARDIVGEQDVGRWDLILCGDVCYEAAMAAHILPWLRGLAATAEVWLAEPGRAYAPSAGMETLADYAVPTSLELEDRTIRHTRLARLLPS